jgi:hypothetical protein
MSNIDRIKDFAMANSKRVLSVGLAAATLALVLPFFAGGFLLLQPSFAPLLAQTGLAPGAGPAWFVTVSVFSAIALSIGAFVVSWNQRSFVVAGLLAASGVMLMIPALVATGYLTAIVFPGPIIGVIIGLGISGLGVAKGMRTVRMTSISISVRGSSEGSR